MKRIPFLIVCLCACVSLMAGPTKANPDQAKSAQDEGTVIIMIDDGSSTPSLFVISSQNLENGIFELIPGDFDEDDFTRNGHFGDFDSDDFIWKWPGDVKQCQGGPSYPTNPPGIIIVRPY